MISAAIVGRPNKVNPATYCYSLSSLGQTMRLSQADTIPCQLDIMPKPQPVSHIVYSSHFRLILNEKE